MEGVVSAQGVRRQLERLGIPCLSHTDEPGMPGVVVVNDRLHIAIFAAVPAFRLVSRMPDGGFLFHAEAATFDTLHRQVLHELSSASPSGPWCRPTRH
ncbi:hypothetical protein ACKI2N_004375 [Cupriavidus sp. 30B13]|uniref:hypothetical protein n=1 Tax=Cupriavidus sp. 30B13 TaxID=3384241 RepID=UPI003B913895